MTTGPDTLTLLAYPLTPDLLGEVHVYEFPDKIREVWEEILVGYRDATGSQGNLPYSGLATALRAIGRTSLNFDPGRKNASPSRMITRKPLKAADIHDAVTVWHQVLMKVPDGDIRFSFASKLADTISNVRPKAVTLADYLTFQGTQPDAPSWVFDAATWEVAQRIAHAAPPWVVDGRAVRLRSDTSGDLMAWDPPLLWEGRWKPTAAPSYATLRIQLRMKTLPWISSPVVVLDPQVSRFTRWPNFAGSAWLEQNDPNAPLLAVRLESRTLEYSSRIALKVWAQLKGQQPIVASDFDLTDKRSPLRALVPRSVRFPVGRGVGMHLIRELSAHVATTLAIPPVTAHNVAGHQFSEADRRMLDRGRDTELLHPDELPAIITAAGCHKLRILVLYRREHTRGRLQRLLAYHFARPDLAEEGMTDGKAVPLADRVEVLVQPAVELLTHGDHDKRAGLADDLIGLDVPDGTRVLALCETEYDEKEWARLRRLSRRKGSGVISPDVADAKHPVNSLLARRKVAAQFLVTGPDSISTTDDEHRDDVDGDPTTSEVVEASAPADPLERLSEQLERDHAGHYAIADLLRVGGLVHPRLGRALAHGQHGITEPLAYVGLHVRQQRGERYKPGRQQLLSWSLAALVPDGEYWRVKAYVVQSHPGGGATGWQDYTPANLAFRANDLPVGKRQDAAFAKSVDIALGQLKHELHATNGYVLFVSGDSVRSLWPRLANKNLECELDDAGLFQGRVPLPGLSQLCGNRPRAIVRVTSGSDDIPRPVQMTRTKLAGGREVVEVTKTTRGLYQLDGARATWILSNVPRQFDGAKLHSRAGSKYSRWSSSGAEQRKTWYAHTATEIFVAHCDGDPLRYAVAAARLCHHALFWEGRTSYPAPVHLAIQMDKNHPQYRRTIDIEDEIDPEDPMK